MQSRKRNIRTRIAWMALSFAVVTMGAAGSQAMAAQGAYKGWFVALDLANTQPTGLDQHYATVLDITNGFQTVKVMDNGADFTWGLKGGYSWGNLGGLSVAFWSFDNEDSINANEGIHYVYPTVFGGFAYNNGLFASLIPLSNPVTYTATSQVKASIIDVDYYRPMQVGEKTTIKWIAGLRSASWEEDQNFAGKGASIYGIDPYYIDQTKHISSDAFGVKLGANLIFGFTEHFSLQGTMAFSFLQGSNDATTTNQTSDGTNKLFDQVSFKDDNIRGEIRDFDVRGAWDWDRYGFWVGYGGQTWDGLVADPTGEQTCCFATQTSHSSRDSIAFNSLHIGAIFRFGGGKK